MVELAGTCKIFKKKINFFFHFFYFFFSGDTIKFVKNDSRSLPESVSIALIKLVEDKKRVEPVDANELSQRLENAMIENESSNQENNKEILLK